MDDIKSSEAKGFDNPVSDMKLDMLGRQPLMQQVYAHLTNLEPGWSVRVGLLAPWGGGKTTVCDWIVNQAKVDGHIPIQYSPWSTKTDAELWHGLYEKLLKGVPDNCLEVKRTGLGKLKFWGSSASRHKVISQLSDAHQISQASLGAVQSIFSISKKDIQELTANLSKDKRILVIIDDLDRVEKALIPRFLLSLRDLMDLDRFSFLLPFDDEIISHALEGYGGTQEYGNNFLDKILDYRVHIPSAPEEKILKLFQSEIEKYCEFAALDDYGALKDYLPSNPRKLKALVRSLRVYEQEAVRHKNDEIDWNVVFFGQMLRIESEKFFRLFVDDTFYKKGEVSKFDTSGVSPWMSTIINRDNGGEKKEKERIESLLDVANITDRLKRERVISLCEFLRRSYGYSKANVISYAFKLIDNPETLTWGEFDNIWGDWKKNKKIQKVSDALNQLAKRIQISNDDMASEFINTLTQKYGEFLHLASSVTLSSEHEHAIKQSKEILLLIGSIIENGVSNTDRAHILSVSNFEKVLEQPLRWIHFNGNDLDKKHRREEVELLKKWVKKAKEYGLSSQLYRYLMGLSLENQIFSEKQKLSKELYSELQEVLDHSLCQSVIEVFEKQNGIIGIMPHDAGVGVKGILLNADSEFWQTTEDNSSLGFKTLEKAATNASVQKNALDCLDLIRKASNEGVQEIQAKEAQEIFKTPQIIEALWDAAIATPLQFRRLSETRKTRKYLISMGVDEGRLKCPNWLTVGSEPESDKRVK